MDIGKRTWKVKQMVNGTRTYTPYGKLTTTIYNQQLNCKLKLHSVQSFSSFKHIENTSCRFKERVRRIIELFRISIEIDLKLTEN
jgi:hypothetical protein